MNENHDLASAIELLKRDIADFRRDLVKLENTLDTFEKRYSSDVLPNIKTWNNTAENIGKVVWLVIAAVITAVLAIIGLK